MSLTASRADDGASTEGDGGHGKIEFPLVGGAPKVWSTTLHLKIANLLAWQMHQ